MRINEKIARRYWLKAAQEQLTTEYRGLGYDVLEESPLGEFTADLCARKGNELIVFEFKSGTSDATRAKRATALRNYVVHELGGQFELVFVSLPHEVNVEIDELERILLEILTSHSTDLQDLATHVMIDEVDGVEINSIAVSEGRIRLSGSGTVYIELQYGSNSDFARGDGVASSDSYPFSFDVVLGMSLQVDSVESLKVDTSSFYN